MKEQKNTKKPEQANKKPTKANTKPQKGNEESAEKVNPLVLWIKKNTVLATAIGLVLAILLTVCSVLLVQYVKTNSYGTGACEYLETRDVSGNNIKYVEMCVEGYGKVVILLDATAAPVTVTNFLKLVKSGFYDGLTFHRIINDFMIQGGDPEGDGTGGQVDANGKEVNIKGEFADNGHFDNADIHHKYGVISMARSNDYNSASSQFFICNADASESLDGKYAAFGYVVQGMSVIDEITEKVFPKTAYADYYEDYSVDPTYNTYKHYVWQYLGNGTIENKKDKPVIKYIKVLESWEG